MSEPTQLTGPDLSEGIDASAIAEGVPVVGHAAGAPVMVVRSGGALFAVGASCTHYGGPLGEGLVVDGQVRCPLHHACFDLRTGAVLGAPALNPIPCYQIETRGSRVHVGAPLPAAPAPAAKATPGAIVIVGAGAAGHAAAEALRRAGHSGAITVIGRDPAAPYDRPNLSKDYLAGTAPEEWMPLRPPGYFDEHAIALRTATEVVAIDTAARRVRLGDGSQLPFDRLLLATGADPIKLSVPGRDAPHVRTLRTLDDCNGIIRAISDGKRRLVVVGSGFIGLEAAATFRARGLEVDVVSPDTEPLVRALGADVGRFLRGVHEQRGVRFHLGESVTAVEADAVVTSGGTRIAADLVLVGIGVKPTLALAAGSGIAVDGGVVVDEHLETNVPGIFAAGDVARFPDPWSRQRIRIEHWAFAQRMGAAAAANMLGAKQPFRVVPFFWSVHYDVTVSVVGHAGPDAAGEIDGDLDAHNFRVRYREGGRVVAVLTVGRDRESLDAERTLENDRRP